MKTDLDIWGERMIDLIEYKGKSYPTFQTNGFSARFAFPYALEVCKGNGVDVGCGKKEWCLPGARAVDLSFRDEYEARELPQLHYDYIFSSHLLEHLRDWVDIVEYWTECLKPGGVLFLYLPDYSQEYWRPWNNKKHKVVIEPNVIKDLMEHLGYVNIFMSGVDLNNSFMIFGEKNRNNVK